MTKTELLDRLAALSKSATRPDQIAIAVAVTAVAACGDDELAELLDAIAADFPERLNGR